MISSTMITAGRLMMPTGGAAAIHCGKRDAEAGEQALHVAAPANRHRHRADGVLENQVPADHPGDQLAQRGVGIGVGAAGDRDHRRELGVAQRRERARQARREVRHGDRRAGLVGRGGAGQHEDAGADDGSDTQERKVERTQAASERLASMFDVADELLDRLRLEQIRIHSASEKFSPPSHARGSDKRTRSINRGTSGWPRQL